MNLENIFADASKENLSSLLFIYLGLIAVMLFAQWQSKKSVGLTIVYVFSFSMIHAIPAYVHSLAGYTPKSESLIQTGVTLQSTYHGFRVACFGMFAFVVGGLLCPLMIRGQGRRKFIQGIPAITTQLPGTLLIISLLSFFILGPIFRRIPSLGSMATAGAAISVVAVYLYCWQAYQMKAGGRFFRGLLSTFMFPFVTITFMGFASFGAYAAATVWMMVVKFYRPRYVAFAVLLLCIYGGLTFYTNWMVNRDSIRSSVWGQRSLETRIERIGTLIDNFELLDTKSQLHLEFIDLRLNQNDLVGKAFKHLQAGRVDYAHGYTLWVAAIAWVPRILWPGKPATGGSGNVVSHFTGQKFAEGTSIGAGQVLEFYVNFGWVGVLGGFLILGFTLRWVDLRAGDYLLTNDYWSAARWILAGLGLIQPGGLMAEVVGSFAAYSVFGFGLHRVFFKRYYDFSEEKLSPAPVRRAPNPSPQRPFNRF